MHTLDYKNPSSEKVCEDTGLLRNIRAETGKILMEKILKIVKKTRNISQRYTFEQRTRERPGMSLPANIDGGVKIWVETICRQYDGYTN